MKLKNIINNRIAAIGAIFMSLAVVSLLSGGFSKISPQKIQKEPREILIKTPGLMYDQVRFKVDPGEVVKITLENTDEMSHNMVITTPGSREEVVSLALKLISQQQQQDFVPETDMVLAYIPLLDPGEKKSITFKAPDKEGVYPYVCTFPGHGAIMYGAIYVTKGALPDIKDDVNIPPADGNTMGSMHHSKLPAMYRTFMPDCGPAGIAVGMTGNVSYCWDAGQCRLRYAWKGGFLSLEKNWASNASKRAELLGSVFYRDGTDFPIRVGTREHIPEPGFKGYSMIKDYPVFHYTLDDIEVSERITPLPEMTGFKRELVFSKLDKPLWFLKNEGDNVQIDTEAGTREGNYFNVQPTGKEVTLIITVRDEE